MKSHRRAQPNEPNQLALPGLKPCHLPSDIGRHEHLTQCTRVESGHLAKIGVNGEVRENPLEPLTERQRIGGLLDSDRKTGSSLTRRHHPDPDLSLTPLFLLTTTQLTHLGSHPKLLSSAGIHRQGRSADQVADLWDGLVGPFFSAMRIGTSCFLSIRDTDTHTPTTLAAL